MQSRKEEKLNEQNELVRSEQIHRRLQALSTRDVQLWSICLLLIVVLSAGFLAVVSPNLSRRPEITVKGGLLPQFFFGLVTLIILFNLHVISQKQMVNATRQELIRELVFNERMESLTNLDPATQLYNRRGIERRLSQELARANRIGGHLTVLIMRLASLEAVNARYGLEAGDQSIAEVSKLLKSTFRGSDTPARYSGSRFLVILPGTAEPQAEFAVRRLQEAVDNWNLTSKTGLEINMVYGVASHVTGCDAGDLLRAAERKLLPASERLASVILSPNIGVVAR